ncbi:uncharacterized protein PG986_001495 [Apiospora aurea]|uniref:Uncharacterized protein n=1 Tax=Apiospora aurea TaxID=335848 RepID=A0ABR1QXP8_9PEZI
MKTFSASAVAATLATSAAAMPPAVLEETPCTSGTPTTTAGYPISYFHATPTQFADKAYQPEADWAGSHILSTYTYGMPLPLETGFAYAQYKCQFKCNSFGGSSFFVKYSEESRHTHITYTTCKRLYLLTFASFYLAGVDETEGALCTCYSDLMDPDTFVADDQAMVGAWNSLCK